MSYITKTGKFTTDPHQAYIILPFGEYKGYALNFFLEILTGALVRSKMGLQQKGYENELGSIFIAIDPSFFIPIDEFKNQVSQLIDEVQKIKPMNGFDAVYIPGYRGEMANLSMLKKGYLEVEDIIWKKFENYYRKVVKKIDSVVHFEIPADNLKRAQDFYKKLFGWKIVDMSTMGMEYFIVRTVETDEHQMPKKPGAINGGLEKRQAPEAQPVIVIDVKNLDKKLKEVTAAGGKIVKPKMQVGNMGLYARIRDTEGNVIGIWQDIKK